jgi:16S rRNA processing protein RimM
MIWRDEKHLVIALKDIKDQDLARTMVGNEVWFPKESKMELMESVAATHPLVGFVVSDSKTGEIGEIAELIELPNNPLFKIIVDDREILIPARDEWVIEIDEAGKKIVMDLPEGLMDI